MLRRQRKPTHPVKTVGGREKELAAVLVPLRYSPNKLYRSRRATSLTIGRHISREKAAQRHFIARIKDNRPLQRANRFFRPQIGNKPIGLKLMRPDQLRI